MKQVYLLLTAILFLSACSKKTYLERSNQDKALQDAVKSVVKNGNSDAKALEAIPVLYAKIKTEKLDAIAAYQSGTDLGRWDKIIGQYEKLQEASIAVNSSTIARELIKAEDYSEIIRQQKTLAAADYYQSAITLLNKGGRDNAKKAYAQFKKTGSYVSNYQDATAKMNEAFEKAVVDVVVNPVEDNSYFSNNGWGNWGMNYSKEYFQQKLVRELNNQGDRFPARFYSDYELQRDTVQPEWAVDLRLRNMNIPQPYRNQYTRQASASVEVGRDTAGNPVYQTVYATIYITKMSFTAQGDMEVQIRDLVNRKTIGYRNIREEYRWQEEQATYRGDSRALSSADWQLINRTSFDTPRREDILSEIYRKQYPNVKNMIVQYSGW